MNQIYISTRDRHRSPSIAPFGGVLSVSVNRLSAMSALAVINRAVFRIFKCSSMSEIWFIRSMFGLEAIGVMLERRQSNFFSKCRCSVLYADAIHRCI